MWSTSCGTRASFQLPYPPPRFLLSTQLIVNVQTVAGVILLLNDYRLSQGKSTLGWLNLWLYGGGMAGLNDIVAGSNPGRHTDRFSAAIAWDYVSPARYLLSVANPISIGYESRDARLY